MLGTNPMCVLSKCTAIELHYPSLQLTSHWDKGASRSLEWMKVVWAPCQAWGLGSRPSWQSQCHHVLEATTQFSSHVWKKVDVLMPGQQTSCRSKIQIQASEVFIDPLLFPRCAKEIKPMRSTTPHPSLLIFHNRYLPWKTGKVWDWRKFPRALKAGHTD